MEDLQEALKDLRDIHAPDPISMWPLAPGWYLVLILLIPIGWLIYRKVKKGFAPDYKKLALIELKNISTRFEIQKDPQAAAGEIALLIRSALVAKYGNQEVASLVGAEWLTYLDKVSSSSMFTQGEGAKIIDVLYQKNVQVDVHALQSATKRLLSKL